MPLVLHLPLTRLGLQRLGSCCRQQPPLGCHDRRRASRWQSAVGDYLRESQTHIDQPDLLLDLIEIDPLQAEEEVGEIALPLGVEDLHRYKARQRSRTDEPCVILPRSNNSCDVGPMSVVIAVRYPSRQSVKS